jgi:hypothetical protein
VAARGAEQQDSTDDGGTGREKSEQSHSYPHRRKPAGAGSGAGGLDAPNLAFRSGLCFLNLAQTPARFFAPFAGGRYLRSWSPTNTAHAHLTALTAAP